MDECGFSTQPNTNAGPDLEANAMVPRPCGVRPVRARQGGSPREKLHPRLPQADARQGTLLTNVTRGAQHERARLVAMSPG